MNNNFDFLAGPAEEVAPRLLGCHIIRKVGGKTLVGRIVETEAYHQTDAASHSYRGQTPRTKIMFGQPGHLYVYFTYGMHYCCNIVTGGEGEGSAVLIRALEPVAGLEPMRTNRPNQPDNQLTNGPAKLCQAFKIDKQSNGHDLSQEPLQLIIKPALAPAKIVRTVRIGISQAKDVPWRFYEHGNSFVSRV